MSYLTSNGGILITTLLSVAAGLLALFAGYYVVVVLLGGGRLHLREGLRWFTVGVAITIGLNVVFAVAIIAMNAAIPATVLRARIDHLIHKGQIVADKLTLTSTGHLIDRWTDCVGLSLNIVGPLDRGPVQLLRDSDVVGGDVHPCTSLVALGGPQATDVVVYNYIRYWHGYQLLTKPLILLLPPAQMRALADVVYLLSVVLFFLTIMPPGVRTVDAAVLAGGFILLTGAADEDSALLHNIALAATFLGGMAVHRIALTGSEKATFMMAVVAASCVGFLDLIIVPPLVPMVLGTAVLSALVASQRDDTPALARGFCATLVAWMVGYLGTMAMRVVVSAALLGDAGAGARSFLGALLYRLNGTLPSGKPYAGFFAPLIRNVNVVRQSPFCLALIAAVGLIVLIRFALGWRRWRPRIAGFFLLPAALPLVWYEIFRNHSEIHYFFTYVWAAFALLCACTGLLLSLDTGSASGGRPDRAADSADAAPDRRHDAPFRAVSVAMRQALRRLAGRAAPMPSRSAIRTVTARIEGA
jgi:hypothetical protein